MVDSNVYPITKPLIVCKNINIRQLVTFFLVNCNCVRYLNDVNVPYMAPIPRPKNESDDLYDIWLI